MKQIDAALAEQHARHRLVVFAGSHEWLPTAEAGEALEWMELQAMRSGLRTRDEILIGELFRKRMQAAATLKAPGEVYVAALSIIADFEGITDTSEAAGKVASLKGTKAVRQYFKEEKKEEQQEQNWGEQIQQAAAIARSWTSPANRLSSLGRVNAAAANVDSMRRAENASSQDFGADARAADWSRPDSEDTAFTQGNTDRYDSLREVAAEIQEQSKTKVAALRTLNGAYGALLESGRYMIEDKKIESAIENFEMAAIIRPEASQPAFELARIYSQQGDKSRARESLQSAIKKGFNDTGRIKQIQALLDR